MRAYNEIKENDRLIIPDTYTINNPLSFFQCASKYQSTISELPFKNVGVLPVVHPHPANPSLFAVTRFNFFDSWPPFRDIESVLKTAGAPIFFFGTEEKPNFWVLVIDADKSCSSGLFGCQGGFPLTR